jgi:hypothetical protein
MIQENITKTIFDPIGLAVTEIAKKYNVEETKEDAIQKIRQGKEPRLGFIVKISKDYLQKVVSDIDLINLLKKNLEISEDMAKKMSLDIKEKLVPILKEILAILEKNENEEDIRYVNPTIGPKINIAETTDENLEKSEKPAIPLKKEKKSIISEKISELIQPPKQNRGPDNYREPIE